VLTQGLERLRAIHLRHHHVQQDEIRVLALGQIETLRPVPRFHDRQPADVRETQLRDGAHVVVVVDHENLHRAPSAARAL